MLQRRSWDHSAFEHFDQQEGKNDRYGDAEQNHSDRVQNCGTERRMSSRLLKYPTFGLRELQTFKLHIVRRSWTLSSHSETFFRNLPGLLAKRCTVSDLVLSINAAFTTQLFFLASFVGIAARWLSISNCTDDSSAMELLRSLVLFARGVRNESLSRSQKPECLPRRSNRQCRSAHAPALAVPTDTTTRKKGKATHNVMTSETNPIKLSATVRTKEYLGRC